jgi:uncharacterized protein
MTLKLQAERIEGTNAIARHSPEGVVVNGIAHTRSVIVPAQGTVVEWQVESFDGLCEADFEKLLPFQPELVIFGSGARLRFPPPACLRALMRQRIGFEAMDTPAACRTYNVLLAEGRSVVAALLFDAVKSPAAPSPQGE